MLQEAKDLEQKADKFEHSHKLRRHVNWIDYGHLALGLGIVARVHRRADQDRGRCVHGHRGRRPGPGRLRLRRPAVDGETAGRRPRRPRRRRPRRRRARQQQERGQVLGALSAAIGRGRGRSSSSSHTPTLTRVANSPHRRRAVDTKSPVCHATRTGHPEPGSACRARCENPA